MTVEPGGRRTSTDFMLTFMLLKKALTTRKRVIVIVFLLTTLITTAAVYTRRPSFESSAAVLVNVERLGVSSSRIDMRQDAAILTTVEAVTSQAEVLRSRELIERLVDRLDPNLFKQPRSRNRFVAMVSDTLNAATEMASDALRSINLLPPPDPRYELIQRIERNLDVSTVRQAQVIRLTFQAPTPDAARIVLRELLNLYQSQATGRRLNSDEPELFLQEAARAKRELDDVEDKLFALRRQYRIVDLAAEKATITERLNALIIKAEGAQDVERPTPQTLLPNAGPASGSDQGVPSGNGFVLTDAAGNVASGVASAQIQSLRSQLNALRIERAALLTTYSADHPRIRTIDQQLATIDTILQQEIAKLTETVNGYRARLSVLLYVDPAITRLTRSVAMLANSYEVYWKAAEDRQIMRQQDARLQIQIIDEPSKPYIPRGPVPGLLVAAGMGAGLLLGVATALALSFLQVHRDADRGRDAAASAA